MSKPEPQPETGIENNVLSRRQLLQAVPSATLALLLSQFRSKLALAQEPESKEGARRRLAHLQHVLHPPEEESYLLDGQVIKLKASKHRFAFSIPKELSLEESNLWKVVPYDKENPVAKIGNERGRTLYHAPRSYLDGEATEKKLQKSARAGTLPPMYPIWMDERGTLCVPKGTISLQPLSFDGREEVLVFAEDHGLKPVDLEPPPSTSDMKFELPPSTSEFASPFVVTREILKEKTVEWCEPNFVYVLGFNNSKEKK